MYVRAQASAHPNLPGCAPSPEDPSVVQHVSKRSVNSADPGSRSSARTAHLPPRPVPEDQSQSVSNVSSLGGLPLTELDSVGEVRRMALHLDDDEVQTLLRTLLAGTDQAAARIADTTRGFLVAQGMHAQPERPDEVAAGIHRLLGRSRFQKGSRSCFTLAQAQAQMRPFVEERKPISVMLTGFPFKQHDNGLKACGPNPDLAEFGALLRLRELHRAVSAIYPPGIELTILTDGGYARPRGWSEVSRYRRAVLRQAQIAGIGDAVRFEDQNRYVADLLGPGDWRDRETGRRQLRRLLSQIAERCHSLEDTRVADRLMNRLLPSEALAGVPTFSELVRSLVYSVPVPTPRDIDPIRWACQVLAAPDDIHRAGLPGELVRARRAVLAAAWRNAVDHLAAALADSSCGVAERYPRHVRLATVASRPGCAGFSYLGGCALLPWHGTGCIDGRGRICVDFLVSALDRGFLPVYAGEPDLASTDVRAGPRSQPVCMIPYSRTIFAQGRRRMDPELLSAVRLRPR